MGFIHDHVGYTCHHGNAAEIWEIKGFSTKSRYLIALGRVRENRGWGGSAPNSPGRRQPLSESDLSCWSSIAGVEGWIWLNLPCLWEMLRSSSSESWAVVTYSRIWWLPLNWGTFGSWDCLSSRKINRNYAYKCLLKYLFHLGDEQEALTCGT